MVPQECTLLYLPPCGGLPPPVTLSFCSVLSREPSSSYSLFTGLPSETLRC